MMTTEYQLRTLDTAEQSIRTAMRCVHSLKLDARATEVMLEQFRSDLRGIEALRSSVREGKP